MRMGGGGFGGAPFNAGRAAFGAARFAHDGHFRHDHFRGRRAFAFVGLPFFDSFYDAPYAYYNDGCYRLVRVRTPYGLRWQREYVCY